MVVVVGFTVGLQLVAVAFVVDSSMGWQIEKKSSTKREEGGETDRERGKKEKEGKKNLLKNE